MADINAHIYLSGNKRILIVDNCTGKTLEHFNSLLVQLFNLDDTTAKEVPAVLPQSEPIDMPPDVSKLRELKTPVTEKQEELLTNANVEINSQQVAELIKMFPDVVLTTGDFAGMTPAEAVDKNGLEAVIGICGSIMEIDQNDIREKLLEISKQYITLDLLKRNAKNADTNVIQEFFCSYRPLIGSNLRTILEKSECSDVNAFFKTKDIQIQQDAYSYCIQNLLDRTKQ